MRRTVMTTAAMALILGAGACASKPKTAPVADTAPAAQTNNTPIDNRQVVEEPTRVIDGELPGSIQDFTVNVGDRVYFNLDQYRLDGDDQDILQRQAAWLQSYPGVRILVAGNCDERGTREYNLALGERRASIVKDYLVSLGIDPARIETVSYGKERPIATETNDAAWALNRNGFTQILSGATS